MNKKWMLIACAGLLAALMIGAALYLASAEEPVENAGTAQNAPVEQKTLTCQGQEYPLKEQLQTVLLIGTDGLEQYREKDRFQDYFNYDQADFLMLLVLDRPANTAKLIQLNRDTMTDVPWLDVLGRYGGTEYKQLCLAFNYGDGGAKSCQNTVNAVSSLLLDAPIQSYIQIPLSAIAVLNDLVGGVPVTFPEDLTAIDPAFTMGATVRLDGKQAERFVRARMVLEDDTNAARMVRQRIYMDSFQTSAREAFDADSNFALKAVEAMAEHMQSDLTAQQLVELIQRLDSADIAPIRSPEGRTEAGEEFYEFHADEASLWELVREAYCA